MRFFRTRQSPRRATKLEESSISNFGGGLNAVDKDIRIPLRHQVVLDNFHRTPDGAQEKRFGSGFVGQITNEATGDILDMEYFNTKIIAVTTTAQVVTFDDDGTVVAIWNPTLAAALPSAPSGWDPDHIVQVDFVPFRDMLIVHNGIDKPIQISDTYAVEYLADPATGSNVNVPIGKYGCTVANYHCVAGIPTAPTTIYISAKGAPATFPGDPAPNDSIALDVGAYAPERGTEIMGIAGFRNVLIVFFPNASVQFTLGIYDADEKHTPEPSDVLSSFGLLGHRCIAATATDLHFADYTGLNSAVKNLSSGLLSTNQMSALVAPLWQRTFEDVTRLSAFAVYDSLRKETLVFTGDGTVLVYSMDQRLRYESWSRYTGFSASSACRSAKGRIFKSIGKKVFQHGNSSFEGEDYSADEVGNWDFTWSTGLAVEAGYIYRDTVNSKFYMALVTHTSGPTTFADDRTSHANYWEEYLGLDIAFVMEMPWHSGQAPRSVKRTRYLALETAGDARFTFELFTDYQFKDADGNEIHDPKASIEMVGGDHRGAGYLQNYGGSRRSNDPRLYAFPARFKSAKFRIRGSSKRPLTIGTIALLSARGRFKLG